MMKPYTTTLNVSACHTGTIIWFDHLGRDCLTMHPGSSCAGQSWEHGWSETVMSYKQWWGWNGYRGTWINGRLYTGNFKMQVVVGAGVKR